MKEGMSRIIEIELFLTRKTIIDKYKHTTGDSYQSLRDELNYLRKKLVGEKPCYRLLSKMGDNNLIEVTKIFKKDIPHTNSHGWWSKENNGFLTTWVSMDEFHCHEEKYPYISELLTQIKKF